MKVPNKKQMSYFQAVKYFQLEPYGDADKDKVPNYLDCRPFDSDKHFLKFSDLKQNLSGKFQFGKQKPIVEARQPLSRKPQKSQYQVPKKVYLYVKSNGTWSKVGQFDKESNLLKQSIEQLLKKGTIEDHVVTGNPNDERKLNRGEKIVKPIIREAKRAKEHFIETAPKAMRTYQQRIGFGTTGAEAKSELGLRIREGLTIGAIPQKRASFKSQLEEIQPTIEEEPEQEMTVEEPEQEMTMEQPIGMEIPQEKGIEISSGGMQEIQRPQKGMPPFSKGWAGSIGGSRPYRPVPYKPTGKIFKPEKRHNSNPKIPVAKFQQFKPPKGSFDLTPKMPVTKFNFLR